MIYYFNSLFCEWQSEGYWFSPLNHKWLQSICPCTTFHKSLWTKVSAKRLLAYTSMFHCTLPVTGNLQPSLSSCPRFARRTCCASRGINTVLKETFWRSSYCCHLVFVSWEPPQDHPTWERWRCLINHIVPVHQKDKCSLIGQNSFRERRKERKTKAKRGRKALKVHVPRDILFYLFN